MTTDICGALERHPIESVREVLRQAEICLEGTLQLAFAADQRATMMAGICGAGAAAFVAAAVTVQDWPLVYGASVTSLLLFAAVLIFAWSARPIDFFLAGYEPRLLSASAADERWTLIYVVEDLQRRICKNRKDIDASSNGFKLGFGLAFAAVPLGLVAFFMTPS